MWLEAGCCCADVRGEMEMNSKKLETAKDKSCSLEPVLYFRYDKCIGCLLKLTVA